MKGSGSPLAVDIETVGVAWDSLDPVVKEYLLSRARSDEERETIPHRLGLHPGTGRIIAIGLWRPEEDRGGVLVEDPARGGDQEDAQAAGPWEPFPEETHVGESREEVPAMVFRGSERQILQEFWRYIGEGAGTIITFNGRAFDGPFLMLRSALLEVVPTRNLVPYRYSFRDHCDLAEVLSFHRVRPLDSFDFWCRRFGLASPKEDMDGSEVEAAYREGRIDAVARYALRDARQTAGLYRKLRPLIEVMES